MALCKNRCKSYITQQREPRKECCPKSTTNSPYDPIKLNIDLYMCSVKLQRSTIFGCRVNRGQAYGTQGLGVSS